MTEYCTTYYTLDKPPKTMYFFARAIERVETPEILAVYALTKSEPTGIEEPLLNQYGIGFRLDGFFVGLGITSPPDFPISYLFSNSEDRGSISKAVEDVSRVLGLKEADDPDIHELVRDHIKERGVVVNEKIH